MSEENRKLKDFEPVKDVHEKIAYLIESAKAVAKTLIWTMDQENVMRTHLTVIDQTTRVMYAWLPKDFDFEKFLNTLTASKTNKCLFSISIPAGNLFFKTDFLGKDRGDLKFSLPGQMFRVQRRLNVRFQIPKGHILRVELPDSLLRKGPSKKRVLDISAGGISFFVGEEDAALYQTGAMIRGASLTIRLKQVTFDAEIRHTRPAEIFDIKGIRVGLSFKKIAPMDSELIAAYVFEESRKYFARFL